jgi:hypothetical protein
MALAYAALYIWVATRAAPAHPAWRTGALCGAAGGGAWLLATVVSAAVPALGALRPGAVLLAGGSALASGVLGGQARGRIADAVVAGFWCGLVLAMSIAVSMLAADNWFATSLMQTIWAHDPTCPQAAGAALAGCEIGDDLGFVAIELAAVPLLMPVIAALGGLVGAASGRGVHAATADATAWRAPAVFAGAMVVVLTAELTLKLV